MECRMAIVKLNSAFSIFSSLNKMLKPSSVFFVLFLSTLFTKDEAKVVEWDPSSGVEPLMCSEGIVVLLVGEEGAGRATVANEVMKSISLNGVSSSTDQTEHSLNRSFFEIAKDLFEVSRPESPASVKCVSSLSDSKTMFTVCEAPGFTELLVDSSGDGDEAMNSNRSIVEDSIAHVLTHCGHIDRLVYVSSTVSSHRVQQRIRQFRILLEKHTEALDLILTHRDLKLISQPREYKRRSAAELKRLRRLNAAIGAAAENDIAYWSQAGPNGPKTVIPTGFNNREKLHDLAKEWLALDGSQRFQIMNGQGDNWSNLVEQQHAAYLAVLGNTIGRRYARDQCLWVLHEYTTLKPTLWSAAISSAIVKASPSLSTDASPEMKSDKEASQSVHIVGKQSSTHTGNRDETNMGARSTDSKKELPKNPEVKQAGVNEDVSGDPVSVCGPFISERAYAVVHSLVEASNANSIDDLDTAALTNTAVTVISSMGHEIEELLTTSVLELKRAETMVSSRRKDWQKSIDVITSPM